MLFLIDNAVCYQICLNSNIPVKVIMSIELLTMRKFFLYVPAKNRKKLNIVEYGDFSGELVRRFPY